MYLPGGDELAGLTRDSGLFAVLQAASVHPAFGS